jgi:hypothetical protein
MIESEFAFWTGVGSFGALWKYEPHTVCTLIVALAQVHPKLIFLLLIYSCA